MCVGVRVYVFECASALCHERAGDVLVAAVEGNSTVSVVRLAGVIDTERRSGRRRRRRVRRDDIVIYT